MVASTVPPIMSTMNRMKVEPEAVEAEDEKLLAKEMQPPSNEKHLYVPKLKGFADFAQAAGDDDGDESSITPVSSSQRTAKKAAQLKWKNQKQ